MENLMSEGLTLMVFGMGFVFVFLTLLVFMTGLMSRLLGKYFPETATPASSRNIAPPAAAAGTQPDDQTIAVISAAIHHYRSR